jgi:hypothetical protein
MSVINSNINLIKFIEQINQEQIAQILAGPIVDQLFNKKSEDGKLGSFDPNSKSAKFLFPIFKEQIAKSFSTPSEFVEKGIRFDLITLKKTGLLDQIKDKDFEDVATKVEEWREKNFTWHFVEAPSPFGTKSYKQAQYPFIRLTLQAVMEEKTPKLSIEGHTSEPMNICLSL